ncbi:MAG TPA: hydrolase [Lentisphaeria bacterium]|nr:MAG: hypothetical protein A2X48_22530 [Lentisphaerae bacterium GWF2_49_21]HBC89502.1 hydrolase [Lentisphaeria bacterium]
MKKSSDLKNTSSRAFLEKLLFCASPSGFEDEAHDLFREYLAPFSERTWGDVIGNAYSVINEKAPFKVMIVGHADEIGLQITQIDENGFLRFRSIGAPNYAAWIGIEVEILGAKGKVPGVIAKKGQEAPKSGDTYEASALWIDIGAKDKAAAAKLVEVGDYAVTRPNFKFLDGGRFVSKALDDKIGVYVVAEVMRELSRRKPKVAVYGVAATQEESGSRGAKVAAEAIRPDAGFVIDVWGANDTPEAKLSDGGEAKLGKGPGIFKNPNNTRLLVDRMRTVAARENIPYQLAPHYQPVSWTDASVLQVAGNGVATALIGIPNRYMHYQTEICDIADVDSAVKLIVETIMSMSGKDRFYRE